MLLRANYKRDAQSRVDVFALGVVLYELLTGRRPFDGATPADVMSAILHQEAAPLSTLRPGVPPQLAWLVRRCLAKDPDRRVQTVRDVRNELEDLLREVEQGVLSESPAGLRTSPPVERRFLLTAAHVRQLSARNPRLIGYPLTYLDNRAESETLVVFLDGIGGDHRGFEASVRSVPYRAIAITLAGFAPGDNYRPVLAFELRQGQGVDFICAADETTDILFSRHPLGVAISKHHDCRRPCRDCRQRPGNPRWAGPRRPRRPHRR